MRRGAAAHQRRLRAGTVTPLHFGLEFHHVGLALRDEAAARLFLAGLGYDVGTPMSDPEQGVRVAMCRGEGLPSLELILADGDAGPVSAILKREEAKFYHSCYVTRDAEASLAAMAAAGLEVAPVVAAKPAVLFEGLPVSFHYVTGFGLIELIHADPHSDRGL
jgi:methylmalonyl-CoA/ethylmalonyl-CoA epimerase